MSLHHKERTSKKGDQEAPDTLEGDGAPSHSFDSIQLTTFYLSQAARSDEYGSQKVATELQGKISELFGASVLPHIPLFNAGLDVLSAAVLKEHLHSKYGVSYSLVDLLGKTSIDSLAYQISASRLPSAKLKPTAAVADYDAVQQKLTSVLEGEAPEITLHD